LGCDDRAGQSAAAAQTLFTPQQRKDVDYIRKTAKVFQPKWWPACSSNSATKFPASIWGRKFVANYVPARALGQQSVSTRGRYVRTRNGYEYKVTEIQVRVMWKPGMVDDPNPVTTTLAEQNNICRSDIGEVIVWHELGHNYITNALAVNHVVELYTNYRVLYSHLQEFYADLTALRHASPHARRVTCQMRLGALDFYDDNEPHTRAAHGIASLLITEMILHPEDWPSVHFPPAGGTEHDHLYL